MSPSGSFTGSSPALNPALRQSRAGVVLLDFVLVAFGVLVAYVARFEGAIPSHFFRHMVVVAPVLATTRILVNTIFGVYRLVWRYVGLLEAVRMAQAVASVSLLLLVFRFTLGPYLPHVSLPLSIIVMEGMFTFLAMAGVRFVPRILRERIRRRTGAATLLIGAGEGGLAIAKESIRHQELGIRPIGFIERYVISKGSSARRGRNG